MRLSRCILCLCALALASCKSDEPAPGIPADAVYDFVTFTETSSTGSVFEMQRDGDSPVIRYTSRYDIEKSSPQITPGKRLIIVYKRSAGALYTSGAIDLYGYAMMSNTRDSVLLHYSQPADAGAESPFDMQALWRTGPYINLQTRIFVARADRPASFVLLADTLTLDDEYPRLRLSYTNKEGNDGENRYTVNASFDISEVWDRPTCRGVIVGFPTPASFSSATFSKSVTGSGTAYGAKDAGGIFSEINYQYTNQ